MKVNLWVEVEPLEVDVDNVEVLPESVSKTFRRACETRRVELVGLLGLTSSSALSSSILSAEAPAGSDFPSASLARFFPMVLYEFGWEIGMWLCSSGCIK